MTEDDQERIAGRQWADSVIDDLAAEHPEYRVGFWRRVKAELKPTDIDPRAMTDEEAREYGKCLVGFGKYHDKRIDDVPLDYWEWLADANAKVQRYLRSRRIAAERAGDDS